MVQRAMEDHRLGDAEMPGIDIGDFGNGRRRFGVAPEEDPDVALDLAAGIALDPDAGEIERLILDQRRDGGAAALGIEAPAVIGALDLTPLHAAAGERDAAMRADVAQREGAPSAARPRTSGSPSTVLATRRPARSFDPGRTRYQSSRR